MTGYPAVTSWPPPIVWPRPADGGRGIVWACCLSVIGDPCRHVTMPDGTIVRPVPDPPAVGEVCPVTRGFYAGGRYAYADTLAAGDVFRHGTYTGYRAYAVEHRTGSDCPAVVVHYEPPDSLPHYRGLCRLTLTPLTVVELDDRHA